MLIICALVHIITPNSRTLWSLAVCARILNIHQQSPTPAPRPQLMSAQAPDLALTAEGEDTKILPLVA